ncbi:hypothetical protein EIP91_003865 [Steccherinum ochraceum]|uniref:FAD-binding PCMH-type domain-containing protein n=1 Tax=Steccherinum ochraceum TaxID=92696 RepID=A0A4R0R9S4_9APHY|nr:hypothetical protein EIP91_003865 [Steccherinum ochraceum]
MSNFDIFRGRFKGDLITPSHPEYHKALDRWAANSIRPAAVVAFVKDARDVGLAIGYARASGLRIAVRGGGHSISGASSSDGGLVVDLSRYMNNVRIDAKKKLAYAQGGANWRAVDIASVQHGLAAVGGTVNHIGVGGFTLGGGYGWLSGAHGLAIDNLVQVTVVTADGVVLVANESQHTDLFWGVRGGGSNFGVVTEFVFKVHPQRHRVFAGRVIFSADSCEKVAAFLDLWWPRARPEEGMISAVVCFVFYNGSEADGRIAYKGLFDIGPLSDWASEIPYEQLNGMMNSHAEWGANYHAKGVLLCDQPSQQLNRIVHQKLMETASDPSLNVAILHEYFPHWKINSRPADATPYRRDLPGNVLVRVQWKDNAPDKAQIAREIVRQLTMLMPQGEGYGNYSDVPSTSVATASDGTKALFREHYPKLQEIKKKFDPDMVFNQWHTIVPE